MVEFVFWASSTFFIVVTVFVVSAFHDYLAKYEFEINVEKKYGKNFLRQWKHVQASKHATKQKISFDEEPETHRTLINKELFKNNYLEGSVFGTWPNIFFKSTGNKKYKVDVEKITQWQPLTKKELDGHFGADFTLEGDVIVGIKKYKKYEL